MSMKCKKEITGILSAIAFFSGAMAVLASDMIPMPDNFERWPIVAMMTFICIVCLGILSYVLSQTFSSINKLAVSIAAQNEKIAEQTKLQSELNGKLTELNISIASKPCAMSTPEFRDFLKEVKHEIE